MIYTLIGKLVVRLGLSYARRRYGRQLIVAAAVAVAAALAGAYAITARSGAREA